MFDVQSIDWEHWAERFREETDGWYNDCYYETDKFKAVMLEFLKENGYI